MKRHDMTKKIDKHKYKDKDNDKDEIPETANIYAIFLKSWWLTHSKYDDMMVIL